MIEMLDPQSYYKGISVQNLNSPRSACFSQSNTDQSKSHSIFPLNEFRIASLTQAVPDSFDKLDLTVSPESILDEYLPWNSDNESVDDALFPALSSYLCTQSCFSGNEPDIREPTLVNDFNQDHHVTDLPAGLANPQNSRPVDVINPLNLQQATSDK